MVDGETELYRALMAVCRRRRSRRTFDGRPVPPEALRLIREVSLTSPYAMGRRDWDILEVTDRELIRRLASAVERRAVELADRLREDLRASFAGYARGFHSFAGAHALLVPIFRDAPGLATALGSVDEALHSLERDSRVKSIACVTMLILLAAESLGLGACFMTGPLVAEDELSRMLRVGRGRRIGAVVPVGYPAEDGDVG